jgi:hypothetical protein
MHAIIIKTHLDALTHVAWWFVDQTIISGLSL